MARQQRGSVLGDLAGALVPLAARDLVLELEDRLRKIPNRINEYGFDPYGLSPEWLRRTALPGVLLHRYYFRTEVFDIERVPAGRCLLVANHAGQLPFDAMMLSTAMLLEAEPPRIARGMGEYWIPRLPFVGTAAARGGSMVGTPDNCRHMLENDECVMVFPEGVRGINKTYRKRYRLQRMGQGFVRLALEAHAPIVPVGIVGSEEQQPGIANLAALGRLLGMPAFPITPTFPWLGPLGLLPLPVKYRLYFGERIDFEGDPTEEDAAIESRVGVVRRALEELLARGLRERRGIFR
jgi:1-acyl-sn-glycerol-3-phosphate acyltransferase